jgi:hypothetical protein
VALRSGAQPNVGWEEAADMRVSEYMTLVVDRAHNLSAWDAFLIGVKQSEFWIDLGQLWLMLFAFSFACCSIVLWWQHRKGDAI